MSYSYDVHERGYWLGENIEKEHAFDNHLSKSLIHFLKKEKAESLVDFGCGLGNYVKQFLLNGFNCEGYDGNPDTYSLSGGVCSTLDLSEKIDLSKKFDWVISLEVGEHLPKQFERVFIENLINHCSKGIILSWAVKGQGGFGHFNEQNNDYIKRVLSEYGFYNDLKAETFLRKNASLSWFKNTIMVFRRA